MRLALAEARKSERRGEVPIGAVLVKDGKKIAAAHNRPIGMRDPSGHAEILCLRRAARRLKNYRLTDTILYVTLEPCAMCAGALIWARVAKVVFGCRDPKSGACGSVLNLSDHPPLNHRFSTQEGVLEEECREILQRFFRKRRNRAARMASKE